MSKDTYYFSHDYNTRNDQKIKKLISKHGYLGYGIFWAIVEDLYNNANALHLDYDSIAFDLRTTKELVKSIVNNFDLFIINGDMFGSMSIQKRLDERDEKSKKARESARYRWDKNKSDANALQTQSDSNAIKERKGKERKGNKIKEKESKFSFKNSLLEFSSNKQLIDDWLLVRKNKNATNSQTAFNSFIEQVKISDIKIDEILKICVENSWSGYKYQWILNERKKVAPKKESDPPSKIGHLYNISQQLDEKYKNLDNQNNQLKNEIPN